MEDLERIARRRRLRRRLHDEAAQADVHADCGEDEHHALPGELLLQVVEAEREGQHADVDARDGDAGGDRSLLLEVALGDEDGWRQGEPEADTCDDDTDTSRRHRALRPTHRANSGGRSNNRHCKSNGTRKTIRCHVERGHRSWRDRYTSAVMCVLTQSSI